MSRNLLMVISGLLLTTAACHHQHPADVEPKPLPSFLEVKNNYALPMEVTIIGGGTSHRLGMVHPGMSSRFEIPSGMLRNGSVVFQANPSVSSQIYRSGEFLLSPGQIVDLTIASVIFNSVTSIRP